MDNVSVTSAQVEDLRAYVWGMCPDLDEQQVAELTAALLSHAITVVMMRPEPSDA